MMETSIIRRIDDTHSILFYSEINAKSTGCLITILLDLETEINQNKKKLKRKFDKFINDKNDKNDKNDTDDNLINNNTIKLSFEVSPILLYIQSRGGDVHSAFSIIDTIKAISIPVHTICTGKVASAGTLISLSGKKRMMTENAYMLIHELRTMSWGKFTEIQQDFENSASLMEHIINYYVKKTKLSYNELKEILKKDVNWNAEKCLENGLIDEII
jgi:ATP-dependent Clp endopeptidase proteolytic subunit ClpP